MIPAPFLAFLWILGAGSLTLGAVMLFIYMGWWVDAQIPLIQAQADHEKKRLQLKAEHERSMLALELKAKESMAKEIYPDQDKK